MHSSHPIYTESLESLQKKAIADINICRHGFTRWVESIRPEDGTRGRFNWAVKCNHDTPANIASTSYVLEALGRSGLLEETITEEDKKEGIEWAVRFIHSAFQSQPTLPVSPIK